MPERLDAVRARPVRRRAEICPGPQLDRYVTAILTATRIPLGAYEIAARLRESGRHAVVVSIYRSLDRLCAAGTVEKVALSAAFRIKDTPQPILMICLRCGTVASLPAPDQHAAVARAVADIGFAIRKLVLETTGLCADCRAQDEA